MLITKEKPSLLSLHISSPRWTNDAGELHSHFTADLSTREGARVASHVGQRHRRITKTRAESLARQPARGSAVVQRHANALKPPVRAGADRVTADRGHPSKDRIFEAWYVVIGP